MLRLLGLRVEVVRGGGVVRWRGGHRVGLGAELRLTCRLGLEMTRLGVRGLSRRIALLLLVRLAVRRWLGGRRIAPAFGSLWGLLWGVVPVGLPGKGRPLVVRWVWLLGRWLW